MGDTQPDTPVLAHGSRPSPTRRPGPLKKSSGDPLRVPGKSECPPPQPVRLRRRHTQVRGQQCPAPLGAAPGSAEGGSLASPRRGQPHTPLLPPPTARSVCGWTGPGGLQREWEEAGGHQTPPQGQPGGSLAAPPRPRPRAAAVPAVPTRARLCGSINSSLSSLKPCGSTWCPRLRSASAMQTREVICDSYLWFSRADSTRYRESAAPAGRLDFGACVSSIPSQMCHPHTRPSAPRAALPFKPIQFQA